MFLLKRTMVLTGTTLIGFPGQHPMMGRLVGQLSQLAFPVGGWFQPGPFSPLPGLSWFRLPIQSWVPMMSVPTMTSRGRPTLSLTCDWPTGKSGRVRLPQRVPSLGHYDPRLSFCCGWDGLPMGCNLHPILPVGDQAAESTADSSLLNHRYKTHPNRDRVTLCSIPWRGTVQDSPVKPRLSNLCFRGGTNLYDLCFRGGNRILSCRNG